MTPATRRDAPSPRSANSPASAATPDCEIDWHAIDWRTVDRNVRRLQARIVKATQAKAWRKVKFLQRLLTCSFSAKAQAVRRVTENKGSRTTGVDGERWRTPRSKAKAIMRLKRRGYTAQPLRRVYIPKKNGKLRPLGIPTLLDRAQQTLHWLALDPIAETVQDLNSYGFRPKRACADAIAQLFIVFSKASSSAYALEGDIEKCFDRISHEWLMTHIPTDKTMLTQWLKAGYVEDNALHATDEGTPQGGIISPTLANLALDGMERMLRQAFPVNSKTQRRAKVNLIRYADDFVISGSSREVLEQEVKPLVVNFLHERGLKLSEEKTVITHLSEGFDFLGFNVRVHKDKLLITPSKASLRRVVEKIKEIVQTHQGSSAGQLILQLNPVLRGWCNYYRHVVSSDTFAWLDNYLFGLLWRWVHRRHRDKNDAWLKQKYITHPNRRGWNFCGPVSSRDEKIRTVALFRPSKVRLERHVKIQSNANPYDPAWEMYFEARDYVQMKQRLHQDHLADYLWHKQAGICPHCQQSLTQERGWEIHHILWRVFGGTDEMSNLQLLHPNCHRQVHQPDYNSLNKVSNNRQSLGRVTSAVERLEPDEAMSFMSGS